VRATHRRSEETRTTATFIADRLSPFQKPVAMIGLLGEDQPDGEHIISPKENR